MIKTEEQHRRHIMACFNTISAFIDEMDEIASKGKSRSGTDQAVSKLPKDVWKPVRDSLKRVYSECESLAQDLAPDELEKRRKPEPLSRTFVWLSVLMRRIEEEIEDLQPSHVEKNYGPMSAEARERLKQHVSKAFSAIQQASLELEKAKQSCAEINS